MSGLLIDVMESRFLILILLFVCDHSIETDLRFVWYISAPTKKFFWVRSGLIFWRNIDTLC